MSVPDLLILLIVAGIAGALGQSLAGYSRSGCLASIALGYIGALIGMWLARELDLPEPLMIRVGGTRFPMVWSIAGSAIFVAVISLLTFRRPSN
jgi:uncharacterized membrane protein YeaQ/YmgE (transglycosylase-associated protein family)